MVGHVKKPKTLKSNENDAGFEQFKREYDCEVFVPNAVALTTVKRADGKHDIITVEIDSVNLTAGKVTVIATEESRAAAVERFKINVVKHGIV